MKRAIEIVQEAWDDLKEIYDECESDAVRRSCASLACCVLEDVMNELKALPPEPSEVNADLLAACERAYKYMPPDGHTIELLRAAINKARGTE